MARYPDRYYRQSAAIPFLARSDGEVRVLLVTLRKGKRWVVPKGVVEESMTPAESAAAEAFEEAGVRGAVSERVLGTYRYSKWGGTCTVEVFSMAVASVLDDWPERSIRSRKWVTPKEAAEMVRSPRLAAIILALEPTPIRRIETCR